MAKIDAASIIRFGLFEVDLARASLTRQGVRLRIQEQPFRILELLLRQSGEIVSRESLRQALWPEGTHVNFDGSLNAALKKLRAALQDDAGKSTLCRDGAPSGVSIPGAGTYY